MAPLPEEVDILSGAELDVLSEVEGDVQFEWVSGELRNAVESVPVECSPVFVGNGKWSAYANSDEWEVQVV